MVYDTVDITVALAIRSICGSIARCRRGPVNTDLLLRMAPEPSKDEESDRFRYSKK